MQYRPLGNTDINVSVITLGTMTFGEQNTERDAFEQLDYAVSQGVTTIDVAEMYPVPPRESTYGSSETMVGHWLAARGHRDQLVIATKVAGKGSNNPGFEYIRGGSRLSAEHIKQAIDGSLKRLQTDYVDLYQLHWPERQSNFFGRLGYSVVEEDDVVALDESIGALEDLVKAGKIRTYGLSNETPWGLMESCRVAKARGMAPPVSVQNPYNLLNRTYEIGLAEMSYRENMGLLAYSPLAFGMLTGKYYGGQRPATGRITIYERFKRYTNPYAEAAADAYVDLARQYQLDPAQMALAFVNQQPFVTGNIIGATTLDQLKVDIASIDVVLSDEILEAIEAIHHQYCNPAP